MPYADKEARKAAARARYAKNPGSQLARNAQYVAAHPGDRAAARKRNYMRTQRAQIDRSRKTRLRNKYGLSLADFNDMWAAQGFACAVCQTPLSQRQAYVDHCHKTGRVRGILCHGCNSSIGFAKDDPSRLRRLAAYLENHPIDKGVETA